MQYWAHAIFGHNAVRAHAISGTCNLREQCMIFLLRHKVTLTFALLERSSVIFSAKKWYVDPLSDVEVAFLYVPVFFTFKEK